LARIQVDLLRPRIGPCELVVHYEYAPSELASAADVSMRIPLVTPAPSEGTALAGGTLEILPSDELRIRADDENWELAGAHMESPDRGVALASSASPCSVSVRVMRSGQSRRADTVITQAWIQSWLNSESRRNRAVFRLTTNRHRIEVFLPRGTTARHVQGAALDGHRVPIGGDDQPSITVDMGDDAPSRERVVEIWYTSPRARHAISQVALDAPDISDARWAARLYWQLATPADEYLLSPPADMVPELDRKWNGLLWAQSARLKQAELEAWIGATQQSPPPVVLNQYLFSSFAASGDAKCTTASRQAILAVVSGLALLVGLALIHFPALRHPAPLFIGGVVLLGAMLAFPERSIGLAQASCLGLALILAACLLKWLVDSRQAKRSVIRGAAFASPDAKTVKAKLAEFDSNSYPTTATASARAQVSQ
jgi:hypothetical protein